MVILNLLFLSHPTAIILSWLSVRHLFRNTKAKTVIIQKIMRLMVYFIMQGL